MGRQALRLAADSIGGVVIRVAERWERPAAEEAEAESVTVAAPAIHAEPGGVEDAEEPPAGPAPCAAGGKPRVSREKKKAEPPPDALDIMPLPDVDGWELPPLSLLDAIEKRRRRSTRSPFRGRPAASSRPSPTTVFRAR